MFKAKTPSMLALAAAILAASFAIPTASARTIYVNGECGNDAWYGQFSNCTSLPPFGPKATIQAALDVADYGDTVVVGGVFEEVYHEHFEHSIEMKSGVHLRSISSDPSDMTINGQNQGTVIWGDGLDSNTIIEGFTITGGLAGAGGGIFLQGSSPQIINCVFADNGANGMGGGGMFIHYFSDPTITNCAFNANWASSPEPEVYPDGGGVLCDFHCNPTFVGCTFTENWADDDGGGIACDRWCSPELTDCDFVGNRAYENCDYYWMASGGGAIHSTSDSYEEEPGQDTPLTLTNCTFTENSSDSCGGAIYCFFHVQPTLTNCVFTENTSSYFGGGMACYGRCAPTLEQCTFDGNVAGQNGGGGMRCWVFSPPTVTSSTFYGNSVVGVGAGIDTDGTSPVTLDKTIIAFNRIGEGLKIAGSNSAITCTDIYGNDNGDWGGAYLPAYLAGPYDNMCLDPLFCDADNHDLTLRSDSPCAPANSPGQCDLIGTWPVGCLLADLDGDGDVDLADLGILLANYGQGGMTYEQGDITGDGNVDLADLGVLLSMYGSSLP
jgi:predicted outer membrane repeat protein